ncbi:hypothetical protein BDU57DRAFT_81919 [Ampelomyces quisqualis]|uniref:Uncharacterized protein n=1 Tax=Ampelomyces quisqualis TaxID=50730 RepID=A0A6A5Q9S9_AMPQU|nr:hypothetical protein BDU57DRAFT_81919 [Ampelomyces quisqualis]
MFLYMFKDSRRDFRRIVRSDSRHGPKELGKSQANYFNQPERNADSKNVVLEPYPETWTGRLTWAMMLLQSRPLDDWMIGESGHDRRNLRPFNIQHG